VTAVQTVVAAIVGLAEEALEQTQVLDGWNNHTDLAAKTLLVAFSPSRGSPVVTSSVDVDDGGLDATVETLTVACTAAAWNGDMEFVLKRGELVDMLSALRAALAADTSLGGVAFDAWLAPTAQWYEDIQARTDDAPARATVQVDFAFTVQVHAP